MNTSALRELLSTTNRVTKSFVSGSMAMNVQTFPRPGSRAFFFSAPTKARIPSASMRSHSRPRKRKSQRFRSGDPWPYPSTASIPGRARRLRRRCAGRPGGGGGGSGLRRRARPEGSRGWRDGCVSRARARRAAPKMEPEEYPARAGRWEERGRGWAETLSPAKPAARAAQRLDRGSDGIPRVELPDAPGRSGPSEHSCP